MFLNTLSFLSSRNISDQVSQPYKTTGKIIVLYILIFKLLDSNLLKSTLLVEIQSTRTKEQNLSIFREKTIFMG